MAATDLKHGKAAGNHNCWRGFRIGSHAGLKIEGPKALGSGLLKAASTSRGIQVDGGWEGGHAVHLANSRRLDGMFRMQSQW